MKHLTYIIFSLLLLVCSPELRGASTDHAALLAQLEIEVSKGNKIALRDLGTLLDKDGASIEAHRILRKYTLFLDNEFNLNESFGKKEFLGFYYDNFEEITFFYPAQVFYISAFQVKEIKHEILPISKNLKTQQTVQLRKLRNELNQAISEKNEADISKHLKSVAKLNTQPAKEYLLDILQKKEFQKSRFKNKEAFILVICQSLQDYSTMETLTTLLDLIQQGHLPVAHAQSVLAHLTNHRLFEDKNIKKGVKRYRHLIDSLKTMESLRYVGYEKVFDFGKGIFPHPVDYYGRIVGLAEEYPWMKKNALYDLLETEHPRSMLYLASDFYKNYRASSMQEKGNAPAISISEYQNLIQEYTQLEIKMSDGQGRFSDPMDKVSSDFKAERILDQNFLLYWMTHHNDFKWNDSYDLYINKNEILAQTENLEKLFRRLNSSNNEAAMKAYRQLTEGNPAEILRLSDKYKQLLRSYNKTLPTIRHQYLEQLSALTDYCRSNNLDYLPSKELKNDLNQLEGELSEKTRFQLENKIINTIQLEEITALEYYACLLEGNQQFNFSIGRILDYFYSKNWATILENDTYLRLFLKKAVLFKRIGTIGLSNSYLKKFNKNDVAVQARLKEVLEIEPDSDIIYLIGELRTEQLETNTDDIKDFLEDPTDFSKNDIKILPIPNKAIAEEIIKKIEKETDKKVLKKFLEYLRVSPQLELVPLYFELIDHPFVYQKKYDVEYTIGDLMVPLIEGVYDIRFVPVQKDKRYDTDKWRMMWKKDKRNYKKWHAQFFNQKIENLASSETLKIKDLNSILNSEYFQAEHLSNCLDALKKIKPLKNIRKLKTPEKLSVKEHLKYFETFQFKPKDLDDIPKLFEVDDANKLFQYLTDKTSTLEDSSEQGTFWNNIFRQPWFSDFINNDKKLTAENKATLGNIKTILETYLEESDFLSEYEDQTTHMNIDQLALMGKSLKDQLETSIKSTRDNATKALVQQSIIARINYKDVGTVLKSIDQFSASENFKPLLFLQKDFGIPVFNLGDSKVRKELINDHAKLTEYDFYKKYLTQFGIDFLNKKGALDFQKINKILQYEIVTPFAGGGGSTRDQFSYGIVKLLELHFKTRLGFHEKLNENQTFYSYSNNKRAEAWRAYLVEQKILPASNAYSPSFNEVVKNK